MVPYYHYVPVKNDQSDLIEQIQWLMDNDDIAQKIAKNGKALYNRLFNLPNMLEDTVSVFQKYAELMTYEPEVPEDRHRYFPEKYDESPDE